jgi:hypothetical protein
MLPAFSEGMKIKMVKYLYEVVDKLFPTMIFNRTSAFQHPPYLFRKELLKQFGQARMELIDEIVDKYSDYSKEFENIVIRCNELKTKCPEKSSLFENYTKNQASECDVLENKMIVSVMVLKSV